VVAPLTAEIGLRALAELAIDEWQELVPRTQVALAPGSQETADGFRSI